MRLLQDGWGSADVAVGRTGHPVTGRGLEVFEPREGNCFHCGAAATFPSNWKNEWFICDGCLSVALPLLRRKVPSALIFKSQKSLVYATLWKPFKSMSLDFIRETLEYALQNARLAETFEPTDVRCDGMCEFDEARGLFRAKKCDGTFSPVLPMSSVTDFYVQEVYRVGYKSYKHYERSELSIETSVPYMPFVDFPFDFPKSSGGIVRNKKKMRQEAEEELSDVLGRKTSETRRRVIPQYNDLMEFNPYSVSTSDDYYQTAADFFHGPE